MSTNFRDSILIGAALITILGCGFGLGRLSHEQPALAPIVEADSLSQETLKGLRSSLDLTPEQEKHIAPELSQLTGRILDSRRETLLKYYESLLQFHKDIAPKLNPRQREILDANRRLLEQERDNRFTQQI